MGFLQPLSPVTSLLDDNPLMPSGAALFVSATVMLLDFTRPKWQPVSSQARDWVVKCLHLYVPKPNGSRNVPQPSVRCCVMHTRRCKCAVPLAPPL